MTRLVYNIYSNISDKKFLEIEKKMSAWECEMSGFLSPIGWRCTKKVTENDALVVDFTKYADEFYGNIGIAFEDQPGKIKFSFI